MTLLKRRATAAICFLSSGLCAATWAAPAQAWTMAGSLNDGFTATAAASANGVILALGGAWLRGGWTVHFYDALHRSWNPSAGHALVSITASVNRAFWGVSAENYIFWSNSGAGWTSFPTNSCEDNNPIAIRQFKGDNSIAVGKDSTGADTLYVISDGTTRVWNGTCWARMPLLPTAAPKSIAVYAASLTNGTTPYPFVVATDQKFYRWNGTQWILLASSGLGVGNGTYTTFVVGADRASLWSYSQSTNSYTPHPWTHGTIRNLGTAFRTPSVSGQPVRIVVSETNGEVYYET